MIFPLESRMGGPYTWGMTNWRDEVNDEGFPVPNEDRNGEFFIRHHDAWTITYQCQLIPGLGWCWRQIDRNPR